MKMQKTIFPCLLALILLIGCTSPVNSDSKTQDNNQTQTLLFASLEQALPLYSSQDQIIRHFAYTLKYNEEYEQASWVAYQLTRENLNGSVTRTDNFRDDPAVTTGSASLNDYKGSGYDRGHLAPAADMTRSKEAMSESFFLSNMSPQNPSFNRGIWSTLESYVRTWAAENDAIYVITGPVLAPGLQTIGPNEVGVPKYFYKVILDDKEPVLKGIGFILANQSSSAPLQSFAVSIDSVESITGIDFFPGLPDSLEKALESGIDARQWNFGSSATKQAKNSQQSIETQTNDETTVYVTKTGKKYHRDGCRSLSKSRIPISLKEAVLGYGPCSICKPPVMPSSEIKKTEPEHQQSSGETVYITKTGAKYHRAGCRYLSKSSIPIPLSEAVKSYSPCSVCKPPTIKTEIEGETKTTSKPSTISSAPEKAENGDIRGADNDGDGRTEPVYVRGYYRKNGTYVRGHYRASPRR